MALLLLIRARNWIRTAKGGRRWVSTIPRRRQRAVGLGTDLRAGSRLPSALFHRRKNSRPCPGSLRV